PVTLSGFLNYTDAIVGRYAGQNVVWELWNEPDGPSFWSPTPNATQYAQLAASVGALFQAKYPNEILVGPAISWIGGWHHGGALDFLDWALNNSLLSNVDAISVHPYRGGLPETVLVAGQQSWIDLRAVLST